MRIFAPQRGGRESAGNFTGFGHARQAHTRLWPTILILVALAAVRPMPFEYSPQEKWYAANLPLHGEVVADVGANVGRLSEFFWVASRGTSQVVSIEPVLENVISIRERILRHGAKGWTVQACAASARSGTVKLEIAKQATGGFNSVVTEAQGTRKVKCRPLSALVPDATVVKLDIEGHEYSVIGEALPRLPAVKAWAVELHRVPTTPLQSALGAFMAHGYRIYAASADVSDSQRWQSQELSASLDWAAVPPAKVHADGTEFKMLHILALRGEAKT